MCCVGNVPQCKQQSFWWIQSALQIRYFVVAAWMVEHPIRAICLLNKNCHKVCIIRCEVRLAIEWKNTIKPRSMELLSSSAVIVPTIASEFI